MKSSAEFYDSFLNKVGRFAEDILAKEVDSNSTPINSSSRYVTQANRTMHFFTLFEDAISINSCIYTAFNIGRLKRISSIRARQLPKLSHLCKRYSFSFLSYLYDVFWGSRYGILILLLEKNNLLLAPILSKVLHIYWVTYKGAIW